MATTIEVERKYTLPARFRLPDLRHVPGVGAVDGADDMILDATYYDTAGLFLALYQTDLIPPLAELIHRKAAQLNLSASWATN